jgi:hypothetical protein
LKSRFQGGHLIPELNDQIDHAFRAGDWATVSDTTLALLNAVEDEKASIEATAHPLGFIHAPLSARDNGSRLRLHLWPKEPFEPQYPAWFVHCHAWPLQSAVVRGMIHDSRYQVNDSASGISQLYEASYQGDKSVLTPSGCKVSCELSSSTVETRGSTYVVPLNTFHTSKAVTDAITVVESGIPTGATALVVGNQSSKRVAYRRRALASVEIVELIHRLVK